MRKAALVVSILFALSFVFGASGCVADPGAKSGKLRVVASFFVMYDFVSQIGGDKVDVSNMLPAGVDPHDWEPSAGDIMKLEKADMLVYSGLGMEGWVDKLGDSLSNQSLIKVEASKGVQAIAGSSDCHVWLDPANAALQVKNIRDALIRKDPANQKYYENNYKQYAQKIAGLDQEWQAASRKFVKKNIIVDHNGYSYLCQAFGLHATALEGSLPDTEPSPSRMMEAVNFIKANGVKTVYSESGTPSKSLSAVARETGAKIDVLSTLEVVTNGAAQKDYISVMKDNLAVLSATLS